MNRNPMLAIGVAAALTLGMTAAQAQNSNSSTMSRPAPGSSMNGNSGMNQKAGKADTHFLTETMQGDMAEVQMGKLAQQKGQSQDVKQFGEMLQADHGQHLQKAQQQAQQMGVTPPQGPNAKQKSAFEKMSKLSDAQFDKQFARHAVADHKKDIAAYKKEAKSKGPLAQFAEETIPTLQKHLQAAQAIESKGAMTGAKAGRK
jgi:putative membrane protein